MIFTDLSYVTSQNLVQIQLQDQVNSSRKSNDSERNDQNSILNSTRKRSYSTVTRTNQIGSVKCDQYRVTRLFFIHWVLFTIRRHNKIFHSNSSQIFEWWLSGFL